MNRIYGLLLIVLSSSVSAEEFFPIGAWFPGLFDDRSSSWDSRLNLLRDAHLNVIHASNEHRNPPADNIKWMDKARNNTRPLKVQLYSWNTPMHWRGKANWWTRTYEAACPAD